MQKEMEYIGPDEVCAMLGVNRAMLNFMRHKNQGPPYIKVHSKRIIYRKAAVEQWLLDQEQDPQARGALA